jgi:hypothetical protein
MQFHRLTRCTNENKFTAALPHGGLSVNSRYSNAPATRQCNEGGSVPKSSMSNCYAWAPQFGTSAGGQFCAPAKLCETIDAQASQAQANHYLPN